MEWNGIGRRKINDIKNESHFLFVIIQMSGSWELMSHGVASMVYLSSW
jgi:hypothetical protein